MLVYLGVHDSSDLEPMT